MTQTLPSQLDDDYSAVSKKLSTRSLELPITFRNNSHLPGVRLLVLLLRSDERPPLALPSTTYGRQNSKYPVIVRPPPPKWSSWKNSRTSISSTSPRQRRMGRYWSMTMTIILIPVCESGSMDGLCACSYTSWWFPARMASELLSAWHPP